VLARRAHQAAHLTIYLSAIVDLECLDCIPGTVSGFSQGGIDMEDQRRPYNAVSDFVDANVDRGSGDKVAFTDPTRELTYGALEAATCQFARGLYALGLRQESRIVLLLLDTVDFPIAFWGAIRAGIVPIPLNTMLPAEQYAYILADSRAEMILVSAPLLDTLAPIVADATACHTAIVVGADEAVGKLAGVATFSLAQVLERGSSARFEAPTLSDEVAFWLYSSGSTGAPKGVKHVHTSLMATARLYGQGVLAVQADDVMFSAAKLFFAYGLGNAMSFPMAVGAHAVLAPGRATPEAILETMRRHQPTIFYGVPTLYAALLAHPQIGPGAGSKRLRQCVSAGEALPPHVGQQWRAKVGVDILDGIGSTEMLHIFVSNRPGEIHYGTSGRPVPGYDAKVVGEDGRVLDANEIGELVVSGPSAAEGYWNQRAKNRRTFVGEWTYTGDKYLREADGCYRYCGRVDDMFKVSGVWVSPFEVEAALITHPSVLEAAVIGVPDHDGLIKPKAFVVLNAGYAPDAGLFETLKEHVKQQAGPWKYPRAIEVRSELPKTATGKIQRFKLREQEAERPGSG
jgi:4-hydroxybenzoate-CoA ligase